MKRLDQPTDRLFLLRILSISLQLSSLLPGTRISSLSSQFSQFSVSSLLTLGQVRALDLREAVSETGTRVDGESTVGLGDGLGLSF